MRRLLTVVALLVVLCGQWIYAQLNGSEGPFNRSRARPDFIYQALDTDRDGALSEAEIEKVSDFLRTLDKDQDGALSSDELVPDFPLAGKCQVVPEPMVACGTWVINSKVISNERVESAAHH